ncbi:MAG: polysaccharide deacetylase [Clostridia bacterium]|nr:polysaccharide deacetylase [Clostridia bacterium]
MTRKICLIITPLVLIGIVVIFMGPQDLIEQLSTKSSNTVNASSVLVLAENNGSNLAEKKAKAQAYPQRSRDKVKKEDKVQQQDVKELFEQQKKEVSRKDGNIEEVSDIEVRVEDAFSKDGDKTAFLTFDDGPSPKTTPIVLDILDEYDIKATFFVVGCQAGKNNYLIKEIDNRGHAIGNHTYSHDYNKLYSDREYFTQELKKTEKILKSILGEQYNTRLFRFPGGSFEKYKQPFKQVLNEYGYTYIDWNALSGDGEGHDIPPDRLISKLKDTASGKDNIIVLMHDSATKKTTLDALPEIIKFLKSKGYNFKILK